MVKKSTLPAIKKETQIALQEKANNITDRIGTPSGAKRITGDARNGTVVFGDNEAAIVPIVIIDFITKRTFYDAPWREGDPYRPPTCYGIAINPNDMVPHKNVEDIGGERQNSTCNTCPMNQWGSDGKGKACKERRVMNVLPPGADYVDDEMWELDISPTSLQSFDKMIRNINDAWGVPPIGAVIELSLDSNVTYAKFEFSNPARNEAVELHFLRMDEAANYLSAISYDVANEDEEEAPARRPVRKKAAKKKTAKRARK